MKRIGFLLILILIVSFTTNSAFAQLTGAGIKVGVGFANIQVNEDIQETDSKMGFGGGAFITYVFNEIVAIQPEVLYAFKGAKFTASDPVYGQIDGELVYDYVEIPILVKGMLPTSGNFKPSVFVGPSVSILTNAKLKAKDSFGHSDSWSIREETNKIDIGLSFGAGVDFELARGAIALDARYDLGLSGTFENYYQLEGNSVWFNGDVNMKNSVISILLGFSFI